MVIIKEIGIIESKPKNNQFILEIIKNFSLTTHFKIEDARYLYSIGNIILSKAIKLSDIIQEMKALRDHNSYESDNYALSDIIKFILVTNGSFITYKDYFNIFDLEFKITSSIASNQMELTIRS